MVLKEMHDVPYAKDSGYHKKVAAIRKQYYWLGMKNDVAEYISRCMECQKVKVEHQHGIVATLAYTRMQMGCSDDGFHHQVT